MEFQLQAPVEIDPERLQPRFPRWLSPVADDSSTKGVAWAGDTVPDATVLGARLREGEAIYLWLVFDFASEPRAYVLPWRLETAEQLQDAMRNASANNTSVHMRQPFEANIDANAPLFYATPQPPLPTKTSLAN